MMSLVMLTKKFKHFLLILCFSAFVTSDLDRWSPIIVGKNIKNIYVKHQNNVTTLYAKNRYLQWMKFQGGNTLGVTWAQNSEQVVFSDNGDAWMLNSSPGAITLRMHNGTTKVLYGYQISIATGREGLFITSNIHKEPYVRVGINAATPQGTSWQLITGNSDIARVACARDICFGVTSSNEMLTTGVLPEIPTDIKWMRVRTVAKQVSANGQNTIWKIDDHGFTWEAVNIFDRNALKINWERRGFDSTVFQDIAVTDKMAFAFPSKQNTPTFDNTIRVRTGCPIFDFEDPDNFNWVHNCEIAPASMTADGCHSAAEGNKFFSCNNRHFSTTMSPMFEIRHDMLHFLIGGGSHNTNYVALVIDKVEVKLASGQRSYKQSDGPACSVLSRWWWDVHDYKNKCAQIKIVDKRTSYWGSTSFDDLRTSPPCFKGMDAIQKQKLNANFHVGQTFSISINLRGFFVNNMRQLTIKASLPVVNGNPLAWFGETFIESRRCMSTIKHKESSNIISKGTSNLIFSFKELYEDAVFRFEIQIDDNDYFARPTSNSTVSLQISVNYADEFVKRWKQNVKVKRSGNEIAKLGVSFRQGPYPLLQTGDIFWIECSIGHIYKSSHHRSYNVLINIYATPKLMLDKIIGLRPEYIVESDLSHNSVKIPEMKIKEDFIRIRFDWKIGAVSPKPRVHKVFTEDVIVDVRYCIRPHCMDIQNEKTEFIWLAKNRKLNFHFTSKEEVRVASTSMKVFTAIFAKSDMLLFICGPYQQSSAKRQRNYRRNCYYSYLNNDFWTGLSSMISNITCYDATEKILYGTNEKGANMKIYGDNFESVLFLEDDEVKTAIGSSCLMPKYVQGDLSDFNPLASPNITFIGNDDFKFIVDSYGGSSQSPSSTQWNAKNKWLCCP